jgi:flavin-dependent dehydrogenase
VRLGAPVSTIRRDGGQWIVNERVKAPMLVGAGGHFCPVARMLNRGANPATLVGAQEVELAIEGRACAITGEMPELYFCTDLRGYGWCFRKGDYVNIGFGRVDPRALPKATSEFLAFLVTTRRVSPHPSWHWRGHAYLLAGTSRRHPVDDAVLLVGDAAGLAYPQSGEGIRPAVESGLMAASTIVRANGRYISDRLQPYARRLAQRYGQHPLVHRLSRIVPQQIPAFLTSRLLDTPWFVRHVVLERWFLHAREEAVGAAG